MPSVGGQQFVDGPRTTDKATWLVQRLVDHLQGIVSFLDIWAEQLNKPLKS